MPSRILEGNVVSAKTDKTVTVLVERRFMHPMYKKYINSSSKYTAHDETNACKEGDHVSIIECRPISKTKRWKVMSGADNAVPSKEKPVKSAKAEKVKAVKTKKAEPKKETAEKADEKKVVKKPVAKKVAAKKPADKKTKSPKKDA